MAMAMAASPFLLLQPLVPKPHLLLGPLHPSLLLRNRHLRCSPNGAAVPEESPKPSPRRGRRKSTESDSESPLPKAKPKATRRKSKKTEQGSDSEGEAGEVPAKRVSRRTRKPKQETKQQEKELETQKEADSEGGAGEMPAKRASRRTRKPKQEKELETQKEADSEGEAGEMPAKRASRRTRKPKQEAKQQEKELEAQEEGVGAAEGVEGDLDDGADLPYEWPPLVCCLGAPRWEFVPTVRVSDRQMHPDQYSTWLHLQWDPPEFARSPGSAASNVAIALTRLGGRAAVLGKVGDDDFGHELVYRMNCERVQTRAIRFDDDVATATAHMKVGFQQDGKGGTSLVADTVTCSAEDSLHKDEINVDVLKEARMLHFNSEALLSPSMHDTLFRAIELSKTFGSKIFFDLNLPLPLWRSRDETKEFISRAWNKSDIIEVSRDELEFLLDHKYYEHKRHTPPQYYLDGFHHTRNWPEYYHYTPEEIAPIWHDGIKLLLVTYGTLRFHYYTPKFHGCLVGTEDALITPTTTDRTGSGDAIVAAVIRKLTTCPGIYEDQDKLERELRFAVAAGIISQWTIGAVRGFPTESATQNLKEQVYVPSMW